MYEIFMTDDPFEFNSFVDEHANDVLIASLDHDLFDRVDSSIELTGMDVVNHLILKTPNFPIVIHSSNRIDGERMKKTLKVHSWDVRIWIGTDWYPTIKLAIRSHRTVELAN
jgi:hypothetical protein